MFAAEKLIDPVESVRSEGSRKVSIENEVKDGKNNVNSQVFKQKAGPVELLKRYIFKYHFWMTLAIIFLAASETADAFSLGYIGATMVFLQQGTDFYMKPLRMIIKWWDTLLVFNVFTIVVKVVLKVIGCQFGTLIPVSYCWISILLDIPCARSNHLSGFCTSSGLDLPYLSDGVIFVCIILQRRIFLSFNFFNVITDTFATTILSAR